MPDHLTAEQFIQHASGVALAFDLPRIRVNPGPSATHFQFQRRLRLLAKVPEALLRELRAGRICLQCRALAIDVEKVTLVALLLRAGQATLMTHLNPCGEGNPSPAFALLFALEAGEILVRLCGLETHEWEMNHQALLIRDALRAELTQVDSYVREQLQRRSWTPQDFEHARDDCLIRLSADKLWSLPVVSAD
jgi:hypothetical protein